MAQCQTPRSTMPNDLWHDAGRLGTRCQTIYGTMPNSSEQDAERFMTRCQMSRNKMSNDLWHDAGRLEARCQTARSKMPNSSEQDAGRENTKREGANHLSPSVSLPQKVGMTRLELATSRPPDVCATNCATSRSLCLRVQRYDFFLLLPNFFVTLFAEKRKMNL